MRGVVVVVVWVWLLSQGVTDDAVEHVVGNGFCQGGWWRWVKEGYVVVGFGWAGVDVWGVPVRWGIGVG